MSRFIFPILFFLTLASPFVVKLALSDADPEPATSGEARRLVIVTPHNRDIRLEFERAFSRWHQEKFGQAVDIEFVAPGGTGDIVRLLTNIYSNLKNPDGILPPPAAVDAQTQYHMVWGGGDFMFNHEMETIPALQAMDLPSGVIAEAFPEPDLAGIDLYDQDSDGMHWVGVCLSSFGIVYSPFVYDRLRESLPASAEPLEYPETWSDLARPELAERVALADPTRSGSAAVAYIMVVQRAMADAEAEARRTIPALADLSDAQFAPVAAAVGLAPSLEALFADETAPAFIRAHPEAVRQYAAMLDAGWAEGMGDLLLIAANARYFTDSASNVPADVSHANAAAGIAIDFYGRVEEELTGSDRIRFISPRAATAVTPDPIAILYGTVGPDLELAERFVEFLLSEEGQLLWILKVGATPGGGGPTRQALRRPPIRRDVYADQSGWTDKNNPFKEAEEFNQRQEWMDEFTETRLVWQTAWMDAESALGQAYRAVLDISDGERREELLARLRALPITRQGVKDLRAQRKAQPPAMQSWWKAEAQARLAELFRKHYSAVEAEARGGA